VSKSKKTLKQSCTGLLFVGIHGYKLLRGEKNPISAASFIHFLSALLKGASSYGHKEVRLNIIEEEKFTIHLLWFFM
jgi:hypothetical protein